MQPELESWAWLDNIAWINRKVCGGLMGRGLLGSRAMCGHGGVKSS